MKKKSILGVLFLFLLTLVGCEQQNSDMHSRQTILFDTIIQIRIYDSDSEDILDECIKKCEYYEQLFSRTLPDSDISKINQANGQPVEVNPETAELIQTALYFCELSDGVFDITLAPISDLWDFQNNPGVLPDKILLETSLSSVGYKNVLVSENTVQLLNPDTQIDLGAIAKGYIADQLKALLIESKIQHAIIDLGGNILTLGGKPDDSPYTIAIQKPFDSHGTPVTIVKTREESVVTSGIYQRYVEINDTIYHHILNPKTGYPINNSIYSVTIISDSSTSADALSTTCLALGLEKGLELISNLNNTEAIFIMDNYEIVYSND